MSDLKQPTYGYRSEKSDRFSRFVVAGEALGLAYLFCLLFIVSFALLLACILIDLFIHLPGAIFELLFIVCMILTVLVFRHNNTKREAPVTIEINADNFIVTKAGQKTGMIANT